MYENFYHNSLFGGLNHPDLPISEADVLLVGIPYEAATSGQKGCSFAPEVLRRFSKNLQLQTRRGRSIESLKVKDVGDIPTFPLDVERNFRSIREHMSVLYNGSQAPVITFGGDHSIAYPEIAALCSQGTVGLVWIDAHRDLLDKMNDSIYSHGCSLRRLIEAGFIRTENVLLVGTRYMEKSESEFVKEKQIKELTMAELEDSDSPRELVKNAITKLSAQVELLVFSIDIDGVDPSAAPGTGTPVAAGMSANLLLNIIADCPARIRAADIVEVSPPSDSAASITIKLVMAVITELCGKWA